MKLTTKTVAEAVALMDQLETRLRSSFSNPITPEEIGVFSARLYLSQISLKRAITGEIEVTNE